ncbi:MAG: hypothetical protein ACRDJC_16730, partial [Thermomicrobiales bacterium]
MNSAIERRGTRVERSEVPVQPVAPRVRLPVGVFGAIRALILPLLLLAFWQLAVHREVYSWS